MRREIKENSAIEGEITITLEQDDYLDDFKKNVNDFKTRFTRKGFRGNTTPNSVIYAEYGYELLYQTCMKKVFTMLKDVKKEDFFTKNVYYDTVFVSSSFPSRNDNIVFTKPGSFSFIFQYGLIKNVNIDDSSLNKLKEIEIETEVCLDINKEELEFFAKKIYFNLLNNRTVVEDLDKINLSDLDFKGVNTSSLFLKNDDVFNNIELKWLLGDFDIRRLIPSKDSSDVGLKCEEFQLAVKENVLFILNAILRKKFRALLREKCIDLFNIDVPLNYLRAKIGSILENRNTKIAEHYLPLFSNAIKWECIRTVIKSNYNVSFTSEESRAYDVVYKYLTNSALFHEYDTMLSQKTTLGTYDDFSDPSLAIIDLKVINILENICKLKIANVGCEDILNKLLK